MVCLPLCGRVWEPSILPLIPALGAEFPATGFASVVVSTSFTFTSGLVGPEFTYRDIHVRYGGRDSGDHFDFGDEIRMEPRRGQ